MKIIRYVSIALILSLLTGCIPAAFVAGAAGGAIVYDKRSIYTMMEDRDMVNEALKKLYYDPELHDKVRITVASFNRVMLMVGQAPTEQLRSRAYELVNSVAGVKRIYNKVTLEQPISKKQQAEDAWITTKVITGMVAQKGLKSSQIKAITEKGTVYLLGVVTPKQGELAANVASHVAGVVQVVKVFEYEQ